MLGIRSGTGIPCGTSGWAATIQKPAWQWGRKAFSPDGKTLALASRGASPCGKLDPGTKPRELRAELPSSISALAFSPDGKEIATLAGSALRRWDLTTGRTAPVHRPDTGRVLPVVFRADGGQLITLSGGVFASLWNAESGATLWRKPGISWDAESGLPAHPRQDNRKLSTAGEGRLAPGCADWPPTALPDAGPEGRPQALQRLRPVSPHLHRRRSVSPLPAEHGPTDPTQHRVRHLAHGRWQTRKLSSTRLRPQRCASRRRYTPRPCTLLTAVGMPWEPGLWSNSIRPIRSWQRPS